jgi:putative iron-regulated protein
MRLPLIAAFACSAMALPVSAADPAQVAQTYVSIGAATFGDALITAKALQTAVDGLIANPSAATLATARAAWIAARPSYTQGEAFRFGNPIVDDWEGGVNAWPLDEGLIDYVDPAYGQSEENPLSTLNVIANPTVTLSGVTVDATQLTPDLISGTLQEAGGLEANVASGYHAVEFLLWGQDLNGTGPGAGNRPFTDFVQGPGCTNGNCDRRAAYLIAVTQLLVNDMAYMAAKWAPGGAAANRIIEDPNSALTAMLTGMGSLSYGELAGQRIRLGLMLNDPEEEQDCFSDNTYNSLYYDAVGIQNVYLGQYTRTDGTIISGPSLSQMVASADPSVDAKLKSDLAASVTALAVIKAAGEAGTAYDQMLAPGNSQGEAVIMEAVDALVTQTASIQRAMTVLGLTGADFTAADDPAEVFQ